MSFVTIGAVGRKTLPVFFLDLRGDFLIVQGDFGKIANVGWRKEALEPYKCEMLVCNILTEMGV